MSQLDYIRNTLKKDPRVFSEICDFNDNVIKYLHDDHLAKLDCKKSILWELSRNSRTRNALNAYISKKLDLGSWYGDFSEQRYGLCLFSRDDISLLSIYLGSVVYEQDIRKIVQHHELKQLKDQIGDAYYFSMKEADLLVKRSQIDALALPIFSGDIYAKIVQAGKFVISACLAAIPQDLGLKFILKFPKNETWDFSHETSMTDQCWEFTKKILGHLAGGEIHVPMMIGG
ncbi:MAG: SctK family type III secretion system sorting platform protein [Puniceicoccales bacterium]|jgi:hypothetical protein|nr:SctK family type III secretion system sorting platform protein [Puniceicoccales bacterium]